MRAAFLFLVLLTVAGCSSQQAFDASRLKMSVDGADTYKAAKIGVGQPF
jgi:predicted component of type VI protein secretion system